MFQGERHCYCKVSDLNCLIKISPFAHFRHFQNVLICFLKTRALLLQLFCWQYQHKETHLITEINYNECF